MEEQNEILAAIRKLDEKFEARFDQVDRKFEGIDQRFEGIDQRFDGIDQRFDGIDQRFDGIDQRFDVVDKRFEKVDERFAGIDHEFATFREDFDAMHRAVINLEGLRSDFRFVAEDVTYLRKRFDAWENGEDDQPSIPARVSALEVRVTRLEKKKGRN